MSQYSRGEFLGLLGLGWSFLGRHSAQAAQLDAQTTKADLVVLNARVYTSDDTLSRAEAFAVREGRFLAVGSTAEIESLKGQNTTVIDAAGHTVVPGFIDAHTHPAWGGISELFSVNLDLRSLEAIKQTLRRVAQTKPAGEWVTGYKYDDTKVVERRALTREDLDEAAPDHPVRVVHRGGHNSWYNSLAFERASVDIGTPEPQGGRIVKRDGRLDGLVAGRANELFRALLPTVTTREQRQAGVKLISEQMTAAGITSVHEAECSATYATAYQDAYVAGELGFRLYILVRGDEPIYDALKASGFYGGLGNEWLKIGGVKFVADGSAQERTMRMSTPFVDRPDDHGILYMTQQEIDEAVEDAHRHRFQIGIHANGDVAIEMVLNAYERVQKQWPRPDPRHRIEHCSLVTPALLRRIKRAGAIPTPFYTYIHYHGNNWVAYGEEKMRSMFAHASFLEHDIPVAPASDYIPGPFEPLMAIQSMVTRKDFEGRVWGANQRISVAQALRVCTLNGAHASFEEGVKGSITAGKLADFVVLEQDPHESDPDRIKEIRVLRTVVGGRSVHMLD